MRRLPFLQDPHALLTEYTLFEPPPLQRRRFLPGYRLRHRLPKLLLSSLKNKFGVLEDTVELLHADISVGIDRLDQLSERLYRLVLNRANLLELQDCVIAAGTL